MWPENERTVEVFCALGSQWAIHVGPGGAFWQGLRYEAIPATLRMMSIPYRDWPELFSGLRIMEAEARTVLNGKQ